MKKVTVNQSILDNIKILHAETMYKLYSEALKMTNGNQKQAAKGLGLDRNTFKRYLIEYNIDYKQYREDSDFNFIDEPSHINQEIFNELFQRIKDISIKNQLLIGTP